MNDQLDATYAVVKAGRSAEYNRRVASHEVGHCLTSRALGSSVDFVTIIPDRQFSGPAYAGALPRRRSIWSMRTGQRRQRRRSSIFVRKLARRKSGCPAYNGLRRSSALRRFASSCLQAPYASASYFLISRRLPPSTISWKRVLLLP
jgi:hypothetical protein